MEILATRLAGGLMFMAAVVTLWLMFDWTRRKLTRAGSRPQPRASGTDPEEPPETVRGRWM